jgi:hypothetical protein
MLIKESSSSLKFLLKFSPIYSMRSVYLWKHREQTWIEGEIYNEKIEKPI